MKAVIIGASGFLGATLSQHLLACGWEVFGYDRIAPELKPPWLAFEQFDVLRDEIQLPPQATAVYYLAQSERYREFPQAADDLFGVNTYGAIRAAQAACAAGVRFFCYTSTGNVYAPSFDPMSEDHPVRRDDPYALSKLAAEEALALFSAKMTVVCTRLFGLFGPEQKRMLPAVLLSRIRSGQAILLEPAPNETPDPDGLRISLTYVADAAWCLERLARLALAGTSLPRLLNVAGPEAISIRRFSIEIGTVVGIEPKFTRAATPRTHDLVADVRRLEALLEPRWTPFSQAVAASFPGAR